MPIRGKLQAILKRRSPMKKSLVKSVRVYRWPLPPSLFLIMDQNI